MPIDMLIFAVLFVLCLFLSVREWRRYRAGNTTQFAFVAQVVCAGLCLDNHVQEAAHAGSDG